MPAQNPVDKRLFQAQPPQKQEDLGRENSTHTVRRTRRPYIMEAPPVPEALKISYQMPRNTLIRIWWKRMMLRPRVIAGMTIMLAGAIFFFVIRAGIQSAGFVILALFILIPISFYRVLAKAVDGNSQFTDPKTLEFSSTRLVITGPNWKSELPWTTFRGFSEDATYFYLHLSDNGIASVIPKSAFTPELEQKFREYAKAGHA